MHKRHIIRENEGSKFMSKSFWFDRQLDENSYQHFPLVFVTLIPPVFSHILSFTITFLALDPFLSFHEAHPPHVLSILAYILVFHRVALTIFSPRCCKQNRAFARNFGHPSAKFGSWTATAMAHFCFVLRPRNFQPADWIYSDSCRTSPRVPVNSASTNKFFHTANYQQLNSITLIYNSLPFRCVFREPILISGHTRIPKFRDHSTWDRY